MSLILQFVMVNIFFKAGNLKYFFPSSLLSKIMVVQI